MNELLEQVSGVEGWATGGHLEDGRASSGQHYFVDGVALCTTGTKYSVHTGARWLLDDGADLFTVPVANVGACDICKISARARPWKLAQTSDDDVLVRITRAFRRLPWLNFKAFGDRLPPEENTPERVADVLEEAVRQLELIQAHHVELNQELVKRDSEALAVGDFLRRALPELSLIQAFLQGEVARKAADLAK
jgi:hypothetical protein